MIGSKLDRRQFCVAAAAGALADANERKIRVAVLGTAHGHAASKIRALRVLPEFDFAGICRPDADEPNEVKVFEGVQWLSLDELLTDVSIEFVAVESRVGRNLEYAQRCIGADKFVHLDKPPGMDLAGLRTLFAEAHRRKRVVQLGYQWRYHPAMQAAIEAARSGWLGDIYAMRATIDKPLSPEERRVLAQAPGGIMFEDGCHLIDRAVALFGKPKKVTSYLRHDATARDGMIDNALAILEYDRAFAEIYMASFQPHGNDYRCLEILGTNGKATAQPFAPARLLVDLKQPAGPYKADAQTLEPAMPPGPAYAPDFREMAHIIRDGNTPSYSQEHDLIAQETLLKVCGVL
jgi:predicted dehydrogenase